MRPIIFLDIDDVLAVSRQYTSFQVIETFKSNNLDGWPELWSGLISVEARDNLVALHAEFLPRYVVSSSWSNYLSREQFGEIFRRTKLRFVDDNLHEHWTTPKRESSTRLAEIENWVSMYGQPMQPILVLDDNESGWSLRASSLDQRRLVVFCEPWVGFIDERLLDAQQRLRAQMRGIQRR